VVIFPRKKDVIGLGPTRPEKTRGEKEVRLPFIAFNKDLGKKKGGIRRQTDLKRQRPASPTSGEKDVGKQKKGRKKRGVSSRCSRNSRGRETEVVPSWLYLRKKNGLESKREKGEEVERKRGFVEDRLATPVKKEERFMFQPQLFKGKKRTGNRCVKKKNGHERRTR